jgi:hypothetical protein
MVKNHNILLRLSLEEKEKLKRNADAEGITVSEYLRQKSLYIHPLNNNYNNYNNGSSKHLLQSRRR